MKSILSLFKKNAWILFIVIITVMFTTNIVSAKCPCDIYEEGGTPCVAAHSTVRALYSDYDGLLYQVRRTSDGKSEGAGRIVVGK